jgi:hypothetical protein
MSARLIPLVAIAALALGGCAKKIDEKDLEGTIADNIGKQLGGQNPKVDCPGGQEAKKGKTFDCVATLGGQKTTVEVKLTDDDGKFTFAVKQTGR